MYIGFFASRDNTTTHYQSGVLRTNCVDCLDRTNVAQYVMGITFIPIALVELGLKTTAVNQVSLNVICDSLKDMYSEMGKCDELVCSVLCVVCCVY